MELIEQFKNYIILQKFSKNTIKNYCSDLSTFVDYLKSQNHYFSILTLPFVLKTEVLESYKKSLSENSNSGQATNQPIKNIPTTTINRRLSAIRKFIDFVVITGLVDKESVGSVKNIEEDNTNPIGYGAPLREAEKFRSYLKSQGNSSNTVKGYISDIKYYLGLRNVSGASSPSTIGRRLYSIKKYISWKNASVNYTPHQTLSPVSKTKTVSLNKILLLILLCIIFFLTSLVIFALYKSSWWLLTENARPRALQEVVSSLDISKFLLNRHKTENIINPTKTALDSKENGSVSDNYPSNGSNELLSNMSNIITLLLYRQTLIDPTEVNANNSSGRNLSEIMKDVENRIRKIFYPTLECPVAKCSSH